VVVLVLLVSLVKVDDACVEFPEGNTDTMIKDWKRDQE
jgi:hypothetical protein